MMATVDCSASPRSRRRGGRRSIDRAPGCSDHANDRMLVGMSTELGAGSPAKIYDVVLLVDFDNVCHHLELSTDVLTAEINRWLALAVGVVPNVAAVSIRLYGGWLQEGSLTKVGSKLLTGIPGDFFPVVDSSAGVDRILRGSIELATRLVRVPQIEWGHTYQEKRGLPRLRMAEKPRPDACQDHESCPIDQIQRISRRRDRECHIDGCSVRNESAFLLREQKMVDTLMACDLIEYARQGVHTIVMSNDLDLLPSVATAAAMNGSGVTHVRGPDAGLGDLYSSELEKLGVGFAEMEEV